jgi:hypothetical protein
MKEIRTLQVTSDKKGKIETDFFVYTRGNKMRQIKTHTIKVVTKDNNTIQG